MQTSLIFLCAFFVVLIIVCVCIINAYNPRCLNCKSRMVVIEQDHVRLGNRTVTYRCERCEFKWRVTDSYKELLDMED